MRRVRLCLRPGQPGTKRLLAQYGKSLVCVRYRYDERTKQRIKTVELIVDRTEWRPEAGSAGGDTVVALRVGWQESGFRFPRPCTLVGPTLYAGFVPRILHGLDEEGGGPIFGTSSRLQG